MSKLLGKLLCFIGWHDWYVLDQWRWNPDYKKLGCDRCGGEWGMSDEHQAVLRWCPEMEEFAVWRLNRPTKKPLVNQ